MDAKSSASGSDVRKSSSRARIQVEPQATAGEPETFTRKRLTSLVHAKWPALSRRQAAELIESIIEEIIFGLIREGEVKLQGFGVFVVREKASRPGRNPRTGAPAEVSSRKSVVFKASPILKDKVQGEGA